MKEIKLILLMFIPFMSLAQDSTSVTFKDTTTVIFTKIVDTVVVVKKQYASDSWTNEIKFKWIRMNAPVVMDNEYIISMGKGVPLIVFINKPKKE